MQFLANSKLFSAQLWGQLKLFEKNGMKDGGLDNLYSFIYQQYDSKKMKTNANKNNTLFKFLATSSKFEFVRKIEKNNPSTSSVNVEKKKESEDVEDILLETTELSSKHKDKTPQKEETGPSLLDSLDDYYDSFISITRKLDDIEDVTEAYNPAKKHCSRSIRDSKSPSVDAENTLTEEDFQQKCRTSSEPESESVLEMLENSRTEIPETPKFQTSLPSSYKVRSQLMKKSNENLNIISQTPISVEEKSEDTNVEDTGEFIPSSQTEIETKRKQKLKITSFFKKLDK